MFDWRRPFGRFGMRAPEEKASAAGPLIAFSAGGRAAWTPRNYLALAAAWSDRPAPRSFRPPSLKTAHRNYTLPQTAEVGDEVLIRRPSSSAFNIVNALKNISGLSWAMFTWRTAPNTWDLTAQGGL